VIGPVTIDESKWWIFTVDNKGNCRHVSTQTLKSISKRGG